MYPYIKVIIVIIHVAYSNTRGNSHLVFMHAFSQYSVVAKRFGKRTQGALKGRQSLRRANRRCKSELRKQENCFLVCVLLVCAICPKIHVYTRTIHTYTKPYKNLYQGTRPYAKAQRHPDQVLLENPSEMSLAKKKRA